MYVMFLATAPVYIQHLYTEKKLTYIPAFQTCPFWGSETSSEASIVSSGKGRAKHTEDCLFDINLLTYSRPLYSGTHGMYSVI